ncbi:MAG: hypothetical protein UU73_C0003G0220 [Candidatus Daviesbacteria bacterium GW2011_GWA1_41_61]|uniref:Uncharacterized protein n=1 Tax=Candidatus Daviesbacteria bacterium GW2011_GWA2_40_9 TaxID=1618424 RepID=A0A0G0U982_9BACT|nr:MAG: hypothetical protein UU26_C0003G0006 [Candidatus Daviesbacteria bacterium GW2011_GWC1_40_9]KKR83821.1 MAG: hypothetical protein UU29_C0001G0041 [Candidatus Daviesbacteria bacterium GW2011_GWA2_40_9]KKR93430.1 MAG: hypothetical protein UU44_C0002G0091 [Candidatus Daviesbacteria bacterium GW2011_GWB1_41_15]KKS15021.1 MAG: hypothetical protein UU73_C0003G0220 [Candidatus Daviesbacteria bacterium GW2011_GWA1_41_61]
MKKDKQLKKLVEKLVEMSFDNKGNLVEEKVQKCVTILKQLPLSKAIIALEAYLLGLRRGVEKRTLQIWSTIPLTGDQVDKISKQMGLNYPVNDVVTSVNPSLLGRLRVKIGDVVYDDSVGKKIVKLQEAIRD